MTLEWLQGLRGLAVLGVVLAHARYFLVGTPHGELGKTLFLPGAMGVDLFFLISGFIMVHTTRGAGGLRDTALFAVRRFARVWPAYAVVTLLWIFIDRGGLWFFQDADRLWHLAGSLAFLPQVPGEAPFFGLVFPLAWTLAFEMYFYLVFGISMLAGRLRWFVFASWMLLTLVLLPATHGGATLNIRQYLSFSWGYMQLATNPLIYEFLAGVAIGLLYHQPRIRFGSAAVAWQAVVCSSGFVLWWGWSGVGGFHGPAGWGWPLALMLLALAIASKTVTLTMPRCLVWVGAVSYSMYLTHYLGQVVLTRWLEKHGLHTQSWNEVFLALLLAIPLAAISHRLLERGLGECLREKLVLLVDRWLPAPAVPEPQEVIKMAKITS
ncbi:acyltransferase family protein [Pseudoduganella sp. DS3]|uniref:Acyltransferase family protein n=1 Tax=Pseudoduganella guangdongensis TaxID=2692179 RepID=A0A6N9HEG6_9BURK|nr:acyltransferase [Pseudoduganella guangdongensis]MYN01542.1 acyltransferase family protein [Pseudoduganella guangdongensis]